MKRASKMWALGLAAVLAFGMTAQAANSPSADDKVVDSITVPAETPEITETVKVDLDASLDSKPVSVPEAAAPATQEAVAAAVTVETAKVTIDGVETEVALPAPEPVAESQRAKVAQDVTRSQNVIREKAEAVMQSAVGSQLTGTQKVVSAAPEVKLTMELKAPENMTAEQISKGVTVPIKPSFDIKKNGSGRMYLYFVLHHLADGTVEYLPTSVKDGVIYATFTSFSPVTIVEQMVYVSEDDNGGEGGNGGNGGGTDNGSNSGSQETQSPATSPKTGEVFPVAGFMALVLVAGAAVCAGKARSRR